MKSPSIVIASQPVSQPPTLSPPPPLPSLPLSHLPAQKERAVDAPPVPEHGPRPSVHEEGDVHGGQAAGDEVIPRVEGGDKDAAEQGLPG